MPSLPGPPSLTSLAGTSQSSKVPPELLSVPEPSPVLDPSPVPVSEPLLSTLVSGLPPPLPQEITTIAANTIKRIFFIIFNFNILLILKSI